jgi:hypothetical protein
MTNEATTTVTYKFNRSCAECAEKFGSNRRDAEFCGDKCRKVYNNRRAQRGAELYDIVMAWRFGDGEGRINEARDLLCSLVSGYNEQDKMKRPGRRSYMKYKTAKNNLNRLPGVPDGR